MGKREKDTQAQREMETEMCVELGYEWTLYLSEFPGGKELME